MSSTSTITKRFSTLEREIEELRWAIRTPKRGIVLSTSGILKGLVPEGKVYTKNVRRKLSASLAKNLHALSR